MTGAAPTKRHSFILSLGLLLDLHSLRTTGRPSSHASLAHNRRPQMRKSAPSAKKDRGVQGFDRAQSSEPVIRRGYPTKGDPSMPSSGRVGTYRRVVPLIALPSFSNSPIGSTLSRMIQIHASHVACDDDAVGNLFPPLILLPRGC